MELDREKSFGSLTAQLLEMASTQNSLRKETANLVKALRLPHVRGRWGELTLKRVAELSGMVDHCDFTEQPVQGSGQGAQRPDMVVHLPGGRQIIVDAKVSLNAYLDALEASGEPERKRYLLHHARQVNSHVMGLSSKQYWNQFKPTPEFVVMFIPGENYFSAALAIKPDLIESAVAKGVVIATPTTLISLLKAVAYGWRQVKSVENAEKISALGTELYQRLKAMAESLNRLGKDIEKCTMTYNRMAGSMEKRVMVSARKLSQFGASPGGSEAIEEIEPVEGRPKTVEYHENEF